MKIKATHPDYFRYGQIAEVTGIALVKHEGRDFRFCYRVQFPDGVEDLWPMSDFGNYDLFEIK